MNCFCLHRCGTVGQAFHSFEFENTIIIVFFKKNLRSTDSKVSRLPGKRPSHTTRITIYG